MKTRNHPIFKVFGIIFAVLVLLAVVFTLFPAVAQGEPASVDGGVPPLSDLGQLFTPEVILMLVFVLTMPVTSLVKRWFGLEGATANIVSNVLLNAVGKGLILFATGQATWQFAVVAFVLGVALDKTVYDLLTKGKSERISELERHTDSEPFGDGEQP
jgi:hypothetical protein